MEIRSAIVFVHVVAAFAFVLSHGVAVYVAFGLRRDPEPRRIGVLLDLVHQTMPVLYVSLLLVVATGVTAAAMAGQLGLLWPWISIGVVVATYVAMLALASRPLAAIREGIGVRSYRMKKDEPDPAPRPPGEVAELVAAWRPEPVAIVGIAALGVLLLLMRTRPF